MLPTIEEIKNWNDTKLDFVITCGEKINWDIKLMEEKQEEVDFYVESLYSEKEQREVK